MNKLAHIRFPWETAPDEGAVTEIAPGVLWARMPLPFKPDHVNVYILDDGDGWTVLDTGIFTRRVVAAWEALLAGPLAGKPVTRIILTHHHPDHVGCAGWFADRGVDLVATRTAYLMARMLRLDVQDSYPPETVTFYRRAGMAARILESRLKDRPFNSADVVAAIPLGYARIAEGDMIRAGGRDWDVRIGNGHAPEHATLWSRDGDLVLAGDQIIAGISSNLGVYPTEPEADPVGAWFESCQRLKSHARDGHLVLPGHQLPFTGLAARLDQLIDNHHTALERLLEHLDTPRTAGECFAPLFGREIDDGAYGLALVESLGHLNHLFGLGQVKRDLREDGAYVWARA